MRSHPAASPKKDERRSAGVSKIRARRYGDVAAPRRALHVGLRTGFARSAWAAQPMHPVARGPLHVAVKAVADLRAAGVASPRPGEEFAWATHYMPDAIVKYLIGPKIWLRHDVFEGDMALAAKLVDARNQAINTFLRLWGESIREQAALTKKAQEAAQIKHTAESRRQQRAQQVRLGQQVVGAARGLRADASFGTRRGAMRVDAEQRLLDACRARLAPHVDEAPPPHTSSIRPARKQADERSLTVATLLALDLPETYKPAI